MIKKVAVGMGIMEFPFSGAAAAAIGKWIDHEPEELVHELERTLLAVGRNFTGQLRKRGRQIAAAQSENGHEIWCQRAAAVEKIVQSIGDVLLITV